MHLRLENPEALWGFLFVAGLAATMLWKASQQPASFSLRRFTLALLAFSFAVVGLARPQWGETVSTTRGVHSNLFVAVDISKSMLAQDISPSRLGFSSAFAQKLLAQMNGVKVALFPFALDGYMIMPLTTDIPAADDLLAALSPAMTTSQGTDFTTSLRTLMEMIQKMEAAVKARGEEWMPSQVVFFSDGETHWPVKDDILDEFRRQHIAIFTVGVGTTTGASIPSETRYGNIRENIKDREGRLVQTRLVPESLKRISQVTGGDYFSARFEDIPRMTQRLTQSMRMGKVTTSFKLEMEHYPWLFAVAFFLFLLELGFGRWEYALRVAWLLLPLAFATHSRPLRAEASEPSRDIASDDQQRSIEAYNRGVDELKGNLNNAIELFQESALLSRNDMVKKKALFNLGDVLLRTGDPSQALQIYQQAFDLNSGDSRFDRETNQKISENIVLASKLQEQMQKQAQGQGDGSSDDGQQKPGNPKDPKGPQKNYNAQQFNEQQKQRIFDLVSSEDQSILQRLQGSSQKKPVAGTVERPW